MWRRRRAMAAGVVAEDDAVERRLDRPGRHAVDAHALLRVGHRALAGHRHHAALGRAVGDLRRGRADQRRHRGHVHDRAAAGRDHVRQAVLEAEEDAGQVHGQHAVPDVERRRHRVDVLGVQDRRVVDADVDAAVALGDAGVERGDGGVVGDVDGGALGVRDARARRPPRRRGRGRPRRRRAPSARQRRGGRRADARRRRRSPRRPCPRRVRGAPPSCSSAAPRRHGTNRRLG